MDREVWWATVQRVVKRHDKWLCTAITKDNPQTKRKNLHHVYDKGLVSRIYKWYSKKLRNKKIAIKQTIQLKSRQKYPKRYCQIRMWKDTPIISYAVQFSSVAQSCPTLCDPMNRSTLGLPVHHQLPEFIQTHVHQVSDAIQPSHPLSSPSPPAPNTSQYQGLFQWVNSLHEVAKVLEFQLQHQSFQWTPRTDLL